MERNWNSAEPAGSFAHRPDPAELGDVLPQGGGRRGGQEACRQRRLGDLASAGGDAVGAGAAAGGESGWGPFALPEQAGVVVEAVAVRHPGGDRLEIGGAAPGFVVVVDTEAAGEEGEAGGGAGLAGGLGDAGLEPAHRAGALAGEDDPLAPGEAEDRGDVVCLPDRQQVDHAAAA